MFFDIRGQECFFVDSFYSPKPIANRIIPITIRRKNMAAAVYFSSASVGIDPKIPVTPLITPAVIRIVFVICFILFFLLFLIYKSSVQIFKKFLGQGYIRKHVA